MFLNEKPSLQQALLLSLAEAPGQAIADLTRGIRLRYRACSVQAIYKELRKLECDGIVVKAGSQFSLSLRWLMVSMDRLRLIYDRYLESRDPALFLPGQGGRKVWYFSDLTRLDDFWVECGLVLFVNATSKTMSSWIPHPWFNLLHSEKEQAFVQAQRAQGYRQLVIVGGNNPLDIELSARWAADDVLEYSHSESPLNEPGNVYWSTIDDYVLTITIDKATSVQLDLLFAAHPKAAGVSSRELHKLLSLKGRHRLTVAHDSRRARRYQKVFKEFFGHH